ncbi:MAG: alpha-D-ribose 1-methylphosphonate 5-phosphate C-P-lyase PhnJ [Deltaproteobacteria bacterium]|jgi:alpha-D-ribose 1-methylphosphonate 5-phosphate C-P lyase|nr:alpha-D-ribose 1-methylphosphonate 5-phosphate C-P-lyase PhnJ [Deltaproteobacteria bacterium]
MGKVKEDKPTVGLNEKAPSSGGGPASKDGPAHDDGPASGLTFSRAAARITRECSLENRGYNFAYLDEDTKRELRRALLKAVAIPGHQVPFAGREMPMPYGWGTGGIQVAASIIGPSDVLKVIDQGSDDTTNAVSIRAFHSSLTGVATTTETEKATVIQTRHRIPETDLREGQIMVYQVPLPEPMRLLEPRESETRTMHALNEYGLIYLRLYEDVARHKEIAISYDYPLMTAGRHAMSPSPVPRFDNPKLHRSKALHLFGAGRERRIYAVPPHTDAVSFDFSDHPFRPQTWPRSCAFCGAADSYLDEIVMDDHGGTMFVCSDTDYCAKRLAARESAAADSTDSAAADSTDSTAADSTDSAAADSTPPRRPNPPPKNPGAAGLTPRGRDAPDADIKALGK